uniref:Trimethyllysine dioxygenase, mitochondrial-like n=1 Tax=Saccoglossus kowalevskii TaxID=10224 RepID=A0ABM0MJH7_SACKO|nr:PREDICTED: trimethyllysine dioxygenase, mitochondrial-like [Saccoglossus kowalevskii]
MNIQPKNMKIKKNGDNRELHIVWPDKHETVYSMEWLEKNSYSGVSQSEWSKKRILWDAGSIQDSMPTVVDYKSYMQHDESLKQVLENLVVYGFAVVGDDVPLSVEETQKVAERISYVRVTLYGKMWSFSSNLQMLDTAYTSEGLRAHVDNTYFNDPAGFKAAENLKTKNPEYYDILSRVGLKHQFIDRDIHVAATGPILYHDPVSNELSQVRFNTYDRTTISHLDNHNLMAFYHALSSYAKEVASSENELWFKLRPGNVLLVDNWRVMHGRSSFTGYRHICGCYMPRDDLIGRFRTLLGMKI